MADTTPSLALPLLAAAQAQKHVAHNEALALLDALVQLAVIDRDLAAPPASPAEGDRYIVAANPSGAWAGWAGRVARYQDGAWLSLAPRPGWSAFVADEAEIYVFVGGAWTPFRAILTTLQNLTRLGLGTTADAANPFAAKLNTALWTALTTGEGGTGDLRYTLNKQAAGNTLSLLMQTGFSGRAEIGLTGDDNLHVKVSADGAAWAEALRIDRASGTVEATGLGNSFRNRLRNAGFRINQRAVSGTVTLAAGAYGHDGFKAGAGGCTYTFARASGVTTLTITAGTLVQVIEGGLCLPEGGTYTLSWLGTAPGRVNGGASAASPLTVTGLTPDANATIEWGPGTLALPTFEPGGRRTVFEHRDNELRRCQRYYVGLPITSSNEYFSQFIPGGNQLMMIVTLPGFMRAVPTIAFTAATNGTFNNGYPNVDSVSAARVALRADASVGSVAWLTSFSATAEL